MIIDVGKTKFYYLTCNDIKRQRHMQQEFKDFDLTKIKPVPTKSGISKEQSGSTGFSRMLDAAVKNMDRTKPFTPFVLLEDDARIYRKFPKTIALPDDADILYIGLCKWAMTNAKTGVRGAVCCSVVSSYPHLVQVFNMLSTHGVIVCSTMGLLTIQKSIFEDFYKNRGYDMTLAHAQPYINSYALRKPLVYQCKLLGGQEIHTKYEITQNSTFIKLLPKEWLNTTNLTNQTKLDRQFEK